MALQVSEGMLALVRQLAQRVGLLSASERERRFGAAAARLSAP